MKRRALLAAIAAGTVGLAGCQGIGRNRRTTFGVPPREATPETTTATTTTTPETPNTPIPGEDPGANVVANPVVPGIGSRTVVSSVGGRRRLVLGQIGGSPPELTRLSAAFVNQPDQGTPAGVWMALTNLADYHREFSFGPTPPFSGYEGRLYRLQGARPVGLVLLPVDDRKYANGEGLVPGDLGSGQSCWRASATYVSPEVRTTLELGPGESAVGRYALLRASSADGCLPERAAYEFASSIEGVSLSVSAWRPSAVGPGDSRFDRSVPDLPGYGRTAWYHEGGNRGVFLEPEGERLRLPKDSTDLTLWNASMSAMVVNRLDWGLYKLHGGDWKYVAPWSVPLQASVLPPGMTAEATFTVDNEGTTVEGFVVDQLGGGLYALRYGTVPVGQGSGIGPLEVRGPLYDVGADVDDGTMVAHAALIEVEGDRITVEPDDVVHVEREGSTLTVRIDRGGGLETVTVERAPDDGDAVELIAEQVVRTAVLGNSIPFFEEGVDRVRVEADPSDIDTPFRRFAGEDATRLAFSYAGDTYVLTRGDAGR